MNRFQAFLKRYWILSGVVAILVLIVLFYSLGFRIGSNGMIVKAGTILLENLPEGTEVYANQNRVGAVKDGVKRIVLTPGTHSIIVTAPESQPWNELVEVRSDEVTVARPLLTPLTVVEDTLSEGTQAEAWKRINATRIPTKAAPLLLADGCAHVYVLGNRIVAEQTSNTECTPPPYLCTPGSEGCLPTVIFEPGETLQALIPYPGRNDALILSSSNVVYVLELDPREPRYFAPLTRGQNLRIASWTDTSIVVAHGTIVRELPL